MEKGVRSCLFEMLNNDIMTDVTFVVQGTEIRAHRVVTGARGGLLREMLDKKDERVVICDEIAPHTLKTILEYLYTDVCTINHLNLFEVMHAARTFKLDNLEQLCAEQVKTKLAFTNIGAFTAQAVNFDSKEYLKICQHYFREHTADIIKTKEFPEISNETLVALVSTEGIKCNELELFGACVKWAKTKCQGQDPKIQASSEELRTALGEAVHKMKFRNTSKEDFYDFVIPMKILTNEEVGQVIVEHQMKSVHSPIN